MRVMSSILIIFPPCQPALGGSPPSTPPNLADWFREFMIVSIFVDTVARAISTWPGSCTRPQWANYYGDRARPTRTAPDHYDHHCQVITKNERRLPTFCFVLSSLEWFVASGSTNRRRFLACLVTCLNTVSTRWRHLGDENTITKCPATCAAILMNPVILSK